MKQIYVTILSLAFLSLVAYGQRGKNGPLTVSSKIAINEYTSLAADASIGNTSITVASSTLNSHNRFSKNLAAGDLIMIIQMQGATINGAPDSANNQISTPNDSSWGAILNYNNCGNNEIREVLSVPNSTTINLTCPLVNDYTAAGKVQIVRIPRYTTLTINNGGEIICDAWNGTVGGVIAMEVLDNTTINTGGQINAYASGFRGGALINSNNIQNNVSYVASTQSNEYGAAKGEGIAGYGSDYNQYGGSFCMGAPANGGGGGDSWNGGGGGGANGGLPSAWVNGFGIPDTLPPGYVAAWKQEYSWMPKFAGSGGGRGGYTWSSTQLDPTLYGPGNPGWGGDDRRSVGGRGGRPLDYWIGKLFIGGGGGAGSEDNNHAGPGGNGGGMVYLVSYGTVSGTGMMLSNGHDGVSDSLLAGDGPGGAGAGGTIIVNSVGTISGISIQANGGNGGNQRNTAPEGEGPGGGGGGGYIGTSNFVGESVSGGVNGTTTTFPTFSPNGATKGGPGDLLLITNFVILVKNDTICPGNQDTLHAILSGTVPAGTTIGWYDSITGGSQLGSGPTFVTPVINKTTVFYVGTCPGDYREPDTVFVRNIIPDVTSANDSICKGDTAILTANGGTSYKWSTGQTTSTIKVWPPVTTVYTLTANLDGCSADTTFTVYIRPALTATTKAIPDTVCPYGLSIVAALGGNGTVAYKWSTGGTSDTIHVNPVVTTTYTATVYGKCDTLKETITVHVFTPVPPVISGPNSRCKGIADTLKVSGDNTYLWSNGTTSTTYITGNINADSTIMVIGFSKQGCPDTTRFNIKVSPTPSVTTLDTNTCLNNPVSIYAQVADTGTTTYLWSPGGETNSSITVPDTGQTYTVTVSNGCINKEVVKLKPVIPVFNACCDKTILIGDDTIIVAKGNSLQSYSWSPSVTCLNPLCDSVKVNPSITTTYTVIGTDSLGCQTEREVTILVETACFNITVPNVFTPSEAGMLGLDKIFYIKTENMSAWSISIYDRWGKVMFQSSNPNEYWDGDTEGGGASPAGVYYYIIHGTCQSTTYKKDGFVQLIR